MGQITHEDLNAKLSQEINNSTILSKDNEVKIQELETLIAEKGNKLIKYEYTIPATHEGQTTVTIPLPTLSQDDVISIILNGTVLYPTTDYTISGSIVTLTQPVLDYANTTFFIRVLKSIPTGGEIPTTDGSLLTDGSVSKQKLDVALQGEIDSSVNHQSKIASTTELGHVKIDGKTINIDPSSGVINAVAEKPIYTQGEYGGDSTYNLTIEGVTEYKEGMRITFKSINVIGDSSTSININNLGKKFLKFPTGGVVQDGNLVGAGGIIDAVYNGSDFRMIGGTDLTDAINVPYSYIAASAKAVKIVNDKVTSPIVWIDAVLNTNITNVTPLRYYKDEHNVVHLNGAVKGNQSNFTTLPIGYRPSKGYSKVIIAYSGDPVAGYKSYFPMITVDSSGLVGTGLTLGTDGVNVIDISFSTE